MLPLGVLAAYLSGWVRLYGAVTIEVFGHLGFALEDAEPMFEAMLADMRRQLTTPPDRALGDVADRRSVTVRPSEVTSLLNR